MAQGRRCACTLPFSLHLTVMILGIVGIVFSIVTTVMTFANNESWYQTNGSAGGAKGLAFWLLITTVLIFVSGLQGLVLPEGQSKWEVGFFLLALVLMLDLSLLIYTVLVVGSPFWFVYMIVVLVVEVWVFRLRTYSKKETARVGILELPVANPGGAYPDHDNGLKAPQPGN